jgi:hypothetical protein
MIFALLQAIQKRQVRKKINRSLTKSYETCAISPYVRPLFGSSLLFLLP